jgi:hypothetical protein
MGHDASRFRGLGLRSVSAGVPKPLRLSACDRPAAAFGGISAAAVDEEIELRRAEAATKSGSFASSG